MRRPPVALRRARLATLVPMLLGGLSVAPGALATPGRPAARAAGLGVGAPAALLLQRDVHRTLFARNGDQRRPIASTTKLMTAWVAVHHARPSQVLTVQPYAATPGESLSGVAAGERLTLTDLLRAMLLPSGNDIAQTLAVDLGGSEARFTGWMNAAARRLGMLNSHFSTPIGLDRPGNYSSAADLGRLADAVLGQPLLAGVVGERSARLADGREVVSRNDLLFGRPWMIGLKTGNTAAAGECLVGAARRDGTTVISVVLGEPTVAARDADSLALLRAGLAAYRAERAVRAGVVYARVPVVGRPDEHVRLFATRSLTLFVASGSRARTTVTIHGVPASASGPLPAGAALGEIDVHRGGRVVARTALVTRAPLAAPPRVTVPSTGQLTRLTRSELARRDRAVGDRAATPAPGLRTARCATISRVTRSPEPAPRLSDLAWLRRVRDRIDREYAQPLDVEALARGAHMSAGHLSRQFRLAYGESPYGYLMTRRIERAMALLRRGDLSVTEVCFAVGCSSLGTFSTRFTELVGVPPSVYRRDAARATAGMPSCVAKQVTRPIRNREAPTPDPRLA